MPTETEIEIDAIRRDARRRVRELRAVRELLMPDSDDAEVMSELTSVTSQLMAALRELR